jgi:hypothetical protein
MITELNDPIEVGAVFGDGVVSPVWFLWSGRRYKIERVTYRWKEKAGESLLHFFSVFDGANTFELIYDSKLLRWTLGRVDVE